jgi:hypothetical protein
MGNIGKHAIARCILGIAILSALEVFAKNDLEYMDRGDRSEGVIQPKTSGNDLELVSSLVDYTEGSSSLPGVLIIRFYMQRPGDAFITVRGVRVAQDYWMNKVHPSRPWRPGFDNEFRWRTDEVLQKLKAVESMYDLGVVVRLGRDVGVTDFVEERVAPAYFYYSQLPSSVVGYRFTFKPITYEVLRCDVFREMNDNAVGPAIFSQVFPSVEPGVPFNIEWKNAAAEDGWYKLVVSGQKKYSKDPVDKVVHFYHVKEVQK